MRLRVTLIGLLLTTIQATAAAQNDDRSLASVAECERLKCLRVPDEYPTIQAAIEAQIDLLPFLIPEG